MYKCREYWIRTSGPFQVNVLAGRPDQPLWQFSLYNEYNQEILYFRIGVIEENRTLIKGTTNLCPNR